MRLAPTTLGRLVGPTQRPVSTGAAIRGPRLCRTGGDHLRPFRRSAYPPKPAVRRHVGLRCRGLPIGELPPDTRYMRMPFNFSTQCACRLLSAAVRV